MIDFYGMSSPNVRKVGIMLEELGLPFEFHHVNVFAGDQYESDFWNINPNRRVPAIIDRDGPGGQPFPVFESCAILIYLAEKHGKFLPADAKGRSLAMQWTMFQAANVGPIFGQLNHFMRVSREGNDYSYGRYERESKRLYAIMNQRLEESPYLAGDTYTIADIATYPWAAYIEQHGFDKSPYPAMMKWIGEIAARPAVAKAWDFFETKVLTMDGAAYGKATPDQITRFYNLPAAK